MVYRDESLLILEVVNDESSFVKKVCSAALIIIMFCARNKILCRTDQRISRQLTTESDKYEHH